MFTTVIRTKQNGRVNKMGEITSLAPARYGQPLEDDAAIYCADEYEGEHIMLFDVTSTFAHRVTASASLFGSRLHSLITS